MALIRVSTPYTGMIMSTRESQSMRERGLALGISQISGGSRTSVGGYKEEEKPEDNSAQFVAAIHVLWMKLWIGSWALVMYLVSVLHVIVQDVLGTALWRLLNQVKFITVANLCVDDFE